MICAQPAGPLQKNAPILALSLLNHISLVIKARHVTLTNNFAFRNEASVLNINYILCDHYVFVFCHYSYTTSGPVSNP